MSAIHEHIVALRPTIEEILKISGTAGASIGCIQDGEFYDAHFGFMDHEQTKTANADTLYSIGSLSKSMLALLFGSLVDDNIVSWNETVQSIIPEFRTQSKDLGDNCTVLDLLSMRSGLPTFNILWYQGNSDPLVSRSDLLSMVNGMTPSFTLRTDWRYTNWGYSIAGALVERKTGIEFHQQLQKAFFQPLGMTRTRLDPQWGEDGNAAQGFIGRNNASLIPIKTQVTDYSTIMAPGGGVCSTIKDLLVYYNAILSAIKDEIDRKRPENPIFKQIGTIFKGHTPMGQQRIETSTQYALGWVKGFLPGCPGVQSPNNGLLRNVPLIGKGTRPQVFFAHTGSVAGSLSTVILLPETRIAVVVLVNTKPACDSSDFIANMILERLLGGCGGHDFAELTREAMDKASRRYSEQNAELESSRVPNTSPKPLKEYRGRYSWKSKSFFVDVFVEDDKLKFQVMGRSDQIYGLEHYHYNTFTWLMTDDEEAERARYVQAAGAYKFVFQTNDIDRVTGFKWVEMGGGPGLFQKD
ncbi:hypothetical protein ACHAO4_009529 [Trichoderma viride]